MSDRLEQLFQAGRALPTETARVEFGFETRLMARLRTESVPGFGYAWKLLPVFAAIVILLGAWNYVSEPLDLSATLGGGAPGELLVNALGGGLQ